MDGSTAWDWTKLPESEYQKAIDDFDTNKTVELMKTANQYGIAPNHLCCGGDSYDTYLQFKNAIDKGWILKD